MKYSRRQFINIMLMGGILGWLAAMIYPVVKFLVPPEKYEAEPDVVDMGTVDDFPIGSSKIFKFGRKPVILIRSNAGKFKAMSATCTHLDCLVQYRSDMDVVWCACHNGKYDLSGRNISGPPPRPLEPFKVSVVNGKVFVRRMT